MLQIMQLKVLRTDVGPAFRARPVFRTNDFRCVATIAADACCRRKLFSTQIRNKRQNGLDCEAKKQKYIHMGTEYVKQRRSWSCRKHTFVNIDLWK